MGETGGHRILGRWVGGGGVLLALAVLGWLGVGWLFPLPEGGGDGAGATIRLMAGREEIGVWRGTGERTQRWVPLERIPPAVVAAVLAAEDRRFHRHGGVDVWAVLRAASANLRHAEIRQGGSTLTQQLARGLFLGPERSWGRKLEEAALALLLELRYSKPRLLEAYLNTIYLGHRQGTAVHGVAAAAALHLGKPLDALRPEEAAFLAAAIRAPNVILTGDRERARRERDRILRAMRAEGALTDAELLAGLARPAPDGRGRAGFPAPYFLELAREELRRRMALPEDGEVRIASGLDPALQRSAERAVRAGVARLERTVPAAGRGKIQAALVAVAPATGEIRALVGGTDHGRSPFNRATRARRQPGSLFKPFVYLAAFEAEREGIGPALTPATLLPDEPIRIRAGAESWSPRNLDRRFHGRVTVRQALEESLNVPAVQVAQEIGLARVVRVAQAVGIVSPLEAVPSLPLGTSAVTLLEVTAAYATLANQGLQAVPTTLAPVQEPDAAAAIGPPPPTVRAVSRQSAYLVTHLLRGIMRDGTGRASRAWGLAEVTAGKTGSTDGLRDAWFVGYTPDLVVGVWVGRDDNRPLGFTGGQAALPIWGAVMREAIRRTPPRPFTPPSGVVFAPVERGTGALACGGGAAVEEAFREGTQPVGAACAEPGDRVRMAMHPIVEWFRTLWR